MEDKRATPYILGLDIGASSVGWAVIDLDRGKPAHLIRCGARVFDCGIEGTDFSEGKDNSRSATRRQARMARRMLARRVRREAKLYRTLAQAGLLPVGDRPDLLAPDALRPGLAAERARYIDGILKGLDAQLKEEVLRDLPDRHRQEQVWLFRLRALALDEKLTPHQLGRALYHLGQRRGYKSNRKERAVLEEPKQESDKAKERKKKLNEVDGGIGQLEDEMRLAGARTYGEYFAGIDPHLRRIRSQYTSRKRYEDEFERIWAAQAKHHAVLTDKLKRQVRRAIFHQRPMKSQAALIGSCEFERRGPKRFERGRKRAPWGLLLAQRFRTLQQVSNARIVARGGAVRDLTTAERDTLLTVLDRQDKLSFRDARKLLKLPPGSAFNWESGGEDRFLGNKTNARLAEVFGDRWWTFTDAERDAVVEDVLSIQKDEALARRGQRYWGLDAEAAARLGQIGLEDGYCGLSRQALAKIVPLMQQGTPYSTAVDQVYGKRHTEPVDFLPPPAPTYPHLRNPMVLRVLAELRKVTNAIIREYGKPDAIRVELARDMRRSKKQRQKSWQRMRQNERDRRKAAEKIAAEAHIDDPSRADIEKVLLAEECAWICPYTGNSISMNALLGPTPAFDVEHIIPFSRCLDDSFLNKTLCEVKENRDHKRNRTPHEAYAANPERWEEILARVGRFKSNARDEKVRRFRLETLEDLSDFATRQLNDTRYATRQATDYLALLYGGRYELGGRLRIQASKGPTTAYLRNEWQLNTILGDGGAKSRDDHRHHAVDAVAIALTDAGTVKMLSDAAERAEHEGRRRFARVEDPWSGFLEDVRQSIDSLCVSHRISRKVNGPLHKETNYGPSKARDAAGNPRCFAVRKRLDALSASDVNLIVDDRVRDLVTAKLAELGGEPKKAFQDPKNHPCFTLKDGRRIPIHAVRVRRSESAIPVGQGPRERYVATGANHHMEVFEVKDAKGRTRWKGRVVSTYEAMRRLTRKPPVPVVDRTPPEGGRFLFSLAPGEIIHLTDANGEVNFYRVRTVSQAKSGSIEIAGARLNDARLKDDIIKAADWLRITSMDTLARMACRKVIITPLGEVRNAND